MKSSSLAVSSVAILMLLLLAPASEAAIVCSDVVKDVRPCLSYLQSGSGAPPAGCCAGVKALASATSTTADKQAACNCLQAASKKLTIKPELAKALPGSCGISLPFTISPNIDCSKIT
ncbi:hypothetical protein F0562_018646 [Nyssa sinensis]|uniref:Non-specific lipid-transfer protein n=1 Tax=Nyssa sinensis TaxID=561372 RepID=A0A5J4ZAC5_9ASTE|nr:hypothetical protein F0562_018646 [Nyssa sinensis]